MPRLASDVDVDGRIVRGLRLRREHIDLVRVQDVLSEDAPDPEILAWAATDDRVLITNDRSTMIGLFVRRAAVGDAIPGLIATTNRQSIGEAIHDILWIVDALSQEEIRLRSPMYLPLR